MSLLCRLALLLFTLAVLPVVPANAVNIKSDNCTIKEVAVLPGSRVHIHCTAKLAGTNVEFLAIPNSNRGDANQLLGLGFSAQAMNTYVSVEFDLDDLSGAAFGCLNADCRQPLGLFLVSPTVVVQRTVAPATALLAPEPEGQAYAALAGVLIIAARRSAHRRALGSRIGP